MDLRLEHLEYKWHQLMARQRAPTRYIVPLWREIVSAYSSKSRYFHTLKHLGDLLHQAELHQDKIRDYDTLLLSIWYHDIIYQCLRKDNEEKSAIFAKYRLEAIKYPRTGIVKCYQQINATKLNNPVINNIDGDTALFLDFDQSVLGSKWMHYKEYAKSIRREYAIFPTFLYNRGRKKLLQLLLKKEKLFVTELYYNSFEAIARDNIKKELSLL